MNIFSSSGSRKGSPVQVSLAAFGKHPGWDDHIPDLGEMTTRLIDVKRVLYVDGIGGSIDSGTWEKLDESERLEGFKHVFLWRLGGDIVVGRMWSSSDGKGRKRYPMIVCAQCRGLPESWVLDNLLPKFEQIQTRCTATSSADDVIAVINEAQKELRGLAQDEASSPPAPPASENLLAHLADCPEMGQDHEGLLRLLYQIEREVVGQRAGRGTRAKHIRVPSCSDTPPQAILMWIRFMTGQVGNDLPLLIVLPHGETWVDLIIGEPVGSQLYGIRVLPGKLPLITQIPYNLDAPFIEKANQRIEAARRGEADEGPLPADTSGRASPSDGDAPGSDPGTGRSGVPRKVLMIFAGVAVLVVGLLLLNESGLVGEAYHVDTGSWIKWWMDKLY